MPAYNHAHTRTHTHTHTHTHTNLPKKSFWDRDKRLRVGGKNAGGGKVTFYSSTAMVKVVERCVQATTCPQHASVARIHNTRSKPDTPPPLFKPHAPS